MSDQPSEYLCASAGCKTRVGRGQIYCSRHRVKPQNGPFSQPYSAAGVAKRAEYQARKKRGGGGTRGPSPVVEGSRALPYSGGKTVCPLYADDPAYPGHHTWESWEEGVAVQRCACGFERRIVLGGGE